MQPDENIDSQLRKIIRKIFGAVLDPSGKYYMQCN